MRDNIEGQSAEPVANGSVSGSSNFAGPVSAATGTNQPAATASAATPTNTPVINTSGSTTSEKGSIDFAAMSKSKEEQTDEELLNNAITEQDKTKAKTIIAKRKKEANRNWFKRNYGKLIIVALTLVLVATGIVFVINLLNSKESESEVAQESKPYTYEEQDPRYGWDVILKDSVEYVYEGVWATDTLDTLKMVDNIEAQKKEHEEQSVYYELLEVYYLALNNQVDSASEIMSQIDENSLSNDDEKYAFYEVMCILANAMSDRDLYTKYDTLRTNIIGTSEYSG